MTFTSQWTAEEIATLKRLRDEGREYTEIATFINRSADACRQQCKRFAIEAATIQPAEKQALSDSSDKARIAELEKKLLAVTTRLDPQRLPVETAAEPPTDPAELWRHAEAQAIRSLDYARERSRFSIDFDATDKGLPVAISFVSDQHISPGNLIDFRRMREDAELIAATPGLYACLGGDGVDNHIKIRSAGLAARSQPHEQYQLFEWYLGIFAPKIVALISGNHEAWTDQIAGIDMVAEIARRHRLCYCPAEAHVKAQLGGVEYAITFRHQYRMNSSFNQGHAVKQLYRMGEELFDIGIVCHHHEPHIESFEAHGLTRWVGRPGSYQITSSYTRQYGWNSTRPTCPTFVLYPGTRDIVGFQDVRKAVRFLKSERG